MYYGDHLAIAEVEISSSNFCVLVDAAVMLYEEEHPQAKSKAISEDEVEDEEESDRIFHLLPRKRRSSSIHPQNPLSSSSTKKKTDPPNPNSQSSLSSCITSRKTRAVQEIDLTGKAKKAKAPPLSWKGREKPERLVQLMRRMVGENLRLIFEKTLCESDVKASQSRLKMPCHGLINRDFLTPVELRIIEEDINNNDKTGVGAILVDQRSVKLGVMLKRWETKGSWNYALVCGWNDIVEANGLKDGDSISVWSFRWCGLLCFALVPPPSPNMT